jgi:metal-sulfur cluster biosynthetic enzyme
MIETAPAVVSEAAVLDALRQVFDPELDEPLVELGFLDRLSIQGDRVELSLRLPTFWCAPNFAYLMAHDAREQLLRVPGVRQAQVRLIDNAYSEEISAGVSAGRAFSEVFPGQADGDELDGLRRLFGRKGFGMRQEQLVRFLLDAGLEAAEIVALRVGDVLDTSDATGLRLRRAGHAALGSSAPSGTAAAGGDGAVPRRAEPARPAGAAERVLRGGAPLMRMYLDRRARLGLPQHRSALLITDAEGEPVAAERLLAYLQECRRQRISMTFNTLMCKGLLAERYGLNQERRVDEGCSAV